MQRRRTSLWGLALGILIVFAGSGTSAAQVMALPLPLGGDGGLGSCDGLCYAWNVAMWAVDAAGRRLGVTFADPAATAPLSFGSQSA